MSSFSSAPVPPVGNPRPASAASRRMRTAALVLGVAALLTFFIPVLGQLAAVAAIVVGAVALARGGFSRRSIAGAVLGGLSIMLSLLVLIGVVAGGAARSGAPVVAETAAPTATPRSFAQPIATTTTPTPTPTPVVAVPSVVGASYQDASASLASLGLQVEASRALTAEEAAVTPVTAQSHAGDVAPGTTVHLTVADPAPAPAPADPAPAAPAEDASTGSTGDGSGSGSGSGSSVYFANCKEAKAAGAAPLYVGDPGYRSKLDGDGDGIACER